MGLSNQAALRTFGPALWDAARQSPAMPPGHWQDRSIPFPAVSPISRRSTQPGAPVAAHALKPPSLRVVKLVHAIGLSPPRGPQFGGIVTAGSPRLAISTSTAGVLVSRAGQHSLPWATMLKDSAMVLPEPLSLPPEQPIGGADLWVSNSSEVSTYLATV